MANFTKISPVAYTLTLVTNPSNAGTLIAFPALDSYEEGTVINISATANEGFTFVNWTIEGVTVSSQSSFTYTMPGQNVTLVANFRQNQVEISDRENEPNNSFSTANAIKVNRKYTGNLYEPYDANYYTFTINKPGRIVLVFEHEYGNDSGEFWHIFLREYNSSNDIYVMSSPLNKAKIESTNIRLPAGTYGIVVEAGYHDSRDY